MSAGRAWQGGLGRNEEEGSGRVEQVRVPRGPDPLPHPPRQPVLVLHVRCSFCQGHPHTGQSDKTKVPCHVPCHSTLWSGFSSKLGGRRTSRHHCTVACGLPVAPELQAMLGPPTGCLTRAFSGSTPQLPQSPHQPRLPQTNAVRSLLSLWVRAPFTSLEHPPCHQHCLPSTKKRQTTPSHRTSQREEAEGEEPQRKTKPMTQTASRAGGAGQAAWRHLHGGPALPPVYSLPREQPPLPQPSCLSDAE